jgi:hypothetical protein
MEFIMQDAIALMVYQNNPSRNALVEDNYKPLADALSDAGFNVKSVLYHDSKVKQLETELERFSAVLVWVNPIMEQGMDRRNLDKLLIDLSNKGVYISANPEVILKLGTKEVLYSTRDMDWGGDTEIYRNYYDFEKYFFNSLNSSTIRILKQYRGDGGKGVFKVKAEKAGEKIVYSVIHATTSDKKQIYTKDELLIEFKKYFENGGLLINQKWVEEIINGMVRCYITGTEVSGFGYQESVALCPQVDDCEVIRPVSRRFYFSEDCGLFQDLRKIMNEKWIPQLQEIHSITDEDMPLLWDIDLFINDVNTKKTDEKFTICEMNLSCVSPFPPSCINYVIKALKTKLSK